MTAWASSSKKQHSYRVSRLRIMTCSTLGAVAGEHLALAHAARLTNSVGSFSLSGPSPPCPHSDPSAPSLRPPPVSTFLHTLALSSQQQQQRQRRSMTSHIPPQVGLLFQVCHSQQTDRSGSGIGAGDDSRVRFRGQLRRGMVVCRLLRRRTWTFPAVHLFPAWCEDVFSRQTSTFFTLKAMFATFDNRFCTKAVFSFSSAVVLWTCCLWFT